MLCYTRHFNLQVFFFIQKYKWVVVNCRCYLEQGSTLLLHYSWDELRQCRPAWPEWNFPLPNSCFHFTGAKVPDVEQMVENHLETLIIKHFDPKKADSIFSAEGEVRTHYLWVIRLSALMNFTRYKITCLNFLFPLLTDTILVRRHDCPSDMAFHVLQAG